MYPKRVIVGDARLAGIPILPVDVNASAGDWCVERVPQLPGEGLRPGLREVKGISEAEVARIVAGQPYTSLRDLWERAAVSRPVAERLVLVGALDSLYDPDEPDAGRGARAAESPARAGEPHAAGPPGGGPVATCWPGSGSWTADAPLPPRSGAVLATFPAFRARKPPQKGHQSAPFAGKVGAGRARRTPWRRGARWRAGGWRGAAAGEGRAVGEGHAVGEGRAAAGRLAGSAGLVEGMVAGGSQALLDLDADRDGFAELVPAGELRELTPAERVETELEILGIDLSQHVVSFYEDLLAQLGVVRSADLHRCRAGSRILVAGVKIATQTPAIRSGMRIIFATLDDATGPVDLAFFESVQPRCAARVFGSWLLVARGRVRRTGGSVSVNGEECWDLAALEEIRAASGIGAVRAAMAAGDVPAQGGASPRQEAGRPPVPPEAGEKIIYPNGFVLSPYAETGSPGPGLKGPPRKLWHASPGSSGGLDAGISNSD